MKRKISFTYKNEIMRIFNHKFNRKILRLFFSTHPMLLFNRFITSLRQGFNFNTFYVIIQWIVVTEVL